MYENAFNKIECNWLSLNNWATANRCSTQSNCNRRGIRRHATELLRRSRPTGGWPGRRPPAIINGAEAKPKWDAGRPSSGLS